MSAESEIDFFISYNRHDRAFAEWIAWILEDAGHQVKIQAWDFRAGENFVLEMDRAATEAKVTIAVLSETYLKSGFARSEWAAAFAQDPTGEMRKLIPVRVKECDLSGLLSQIVYIDLVGLAEEEAQERLMHEISQARSKPDRKPDFPNSQASVPSRSKPVFPPSIPANLPRISDVFVGREVNLEELHKRLQTGRATAIWAIAGMGGIGKTELAAQYAFQHRDLGTYVGGICWLKGREELGTQIVAFARSHLQMAFPENVELSEQVRLCWAQWQLAESLIVFDDVQDYGDIEPFLPPQLTHFKILLTTRSRFGSPVQDYEIQVLSEEASLNLLRSLASDGRINQDLEGAKQICEWLGYLPLGLELVGRYLKQKPGTSIAKLWERLQEQKLAAKALLKAEPGMTASLSVTAAFELSWQELNQEAQQLAALLSLFALAEIPWSLVQQCLPNLDEEELEDLRDEQLLNSSLLSFERGENYQLHQLLREFFAVKREQRADAEEMKRSFCGVMVEESRNISELLNREQIEQIAPSIPHIAEAALCLQPYIEDKDIITPFTRIGWFYARQASYPDARLWHEKCLSIAERHFENTHIAIATASHNLAGIYYIQGKFDEVESLLLNAVEIYKQCLKDNHPSVASALVALAELYHDQGRYHEAEIYFFRAKEIYNDRIGSDCAEMAPVLNNLACLYKSLGRYQDAEDFFMQALTISEQHWGKNHPYVARTLGNIAEIYEIRGYYDKAEAHYSRSLQIAQNYYGTEHPGLAPVLNNLAGLRILQERYKEAKQLYFEALKLSCESLGESHPSTLKIWRNIQILIANVLRKNRVSELF